MLDITKLWDTRYLFGPALPTLSRSDQIFFWIAVVFVVLAVVAKVWSWYTENGRPKKILLNRKFHVLLTIGLGLLVWYGARLEQIPWIATHFTALLLLAVFLVWDFFIIRYYWRDYRRQEKIWLENRVKQKYLTK